MKNRYGYEVDPKGAAMGITDLGVEVYNPHEEAIEFRLWFGDPADDETPKRRAYFLRIGGDPRELVPKTCEPDGFCYLPFGIDKYEVKWKKSGTSLEGHTVHLNYGDTIGRGVKPTRDWILAARRGQRRIY